MCFKSFKITAFAVLTIVFAITAAGYGQSKEADGAEAGGSTSGYYIAGNELKLEKLAPYEKRMEGTVACADFSIIPLYVVTQFIEAPAGASIREAAVRNISITQPMLGKIAFDSGFLPDFRVIEPAKDGNNSIVFNLSDISSFIGSGLAIQLNFISGPIGKYTLKNYETISGTTEEAAMYFDKYAIENKVKPDDLRFSVKYRLELKTSEGGKEAVYYKDISLTMLPGDFISPDSQTVKTGNKEPFKKLK